MVAAANTIDHVRPRVAALVGDAPVLAHNAHFGRRFVERTSLRAELRLEDVLGLKVGRIPLVEQASNIERFKKDLDRLVLRGHSLHAALIREFRLEHEDEKVRKLLKDTELPHFSSEYQIWYTEAQAVVRQLLPDRLRDFCAYYERPKSRKDLTLASYRIADAVEGVAVSTASPMRRSLILATSARCCNNSLRSCRPHSSASGAPYSISSRPYRPICSIRNWRRRECSHDMVTIEPPAYSPALCWNIICHRYPRTTPSR